MGRDVYRDSCGRFTTERLASSKQSGDRQFIRLFGSWTELKPVTAESFHKRMRQIAEAQERAARGERPWIDTTS